MISRFPQMLHENKTPVTPDVIRKILSVSEPEFKFQLLALVSSGMRSGELGQIRPKTPRFLHVQT